MSKQKTAQLVFILGGIGLVGLLIVSVFVRELFLDTFPGYANTTEEPTTVTSEELGFDPLVTVLPPEERFPAIPQALETDPQRGAENPTVTIIEFGDFQCASCATMSPILEEVLSEYPNDVAHVWKDYPLPTLHTNAEEAAEAARCAQEQGKFWEYHDVLLSNQSQFAFDPWTDFAQQTELDTDAFNTCLSSDSTQRYVTEGFLIATSLELDQTPSYYINDTQLVGVQTIETLREVIDKELSEEQE